MNADFQARLRSAIFSPFRLTRQLESVAGDGIEREYVFFGKMEHPEQLDKADHYEDQEQWRMFVPCKEENREIVVRIRKTVKYYRHGTSTEFGQKDPEYSLTIKSYVKGDPGTVEAESELTPSAGEPMLAVFRASGDGMIKRRYFFRVDNPEGARTSDGGYFWWEVDAFFDFERMAKEGAGEQADMEYFHPYVKLDLEVASFDLQLTRDPKEPSETVRFEWPFPIELNDVVYSQPHERSERDAKRVEEIMSKYMRAKV